MSAIPPWEMLRADMNYDGLVTISDIWLWIKWLFFLPGDSTIWLVTDRVYRLAIFLELSAADYGGWLSGFLSVFFWVVLPILSIVPEFIYGLVKENQPTRRKDSEPPNELPLSRRAKRLRSNLGYGESPPNRVDDR